MRGSQFALIWKKRLKCQLDWLPGWRAFWRIASQVLRYCVSRNNGRDRNLPLGPLHEFWAQPSLQWWWYLTVYNGLTMLRVKLEFFSSDVDYPYALMIVGCFRSNAVSEYSLLRKRIQILEGKCQKFAFRMTDIEIESCDFHAVNKMIISMISIDDEDYTQDLAEVCLKRTLDNPIPISWFIPWNHCKSKACWNIFLGINDMDFWCVKKMQPYLQRMSWIFCMRKLLDGVQNAKMTLSTSFELRFVDAVECGLNVVQDMGYDLLWSRRLVLLQAISLAVRRFLLDRSCQCPP